MSKEEFLKIQTCVLKVNIHCDGCKHKVKKILQKIDGVFKTRIDAEQGKVTVSGNVDADVLIKKLAKSGKHAELWGAPKPNNPNPNPGPNPFKNMQIDGGKGGNNKPKGNNNPNPNQKNGPNPNQNHQQPKGGLNPNPIPQGPQLTPQQMQQLIQQQQLNSMKDLGKLQAQMKDMKMPGNPNPKSAKFAAVDDLSDEDDDYSDDDEFSGEDDDFDDEDDEPQMKMMGNGKNMMMNAGMQQQLMNAQKAAAAAAGAGKKGGGGGGNGPVPVQVNVSGGKNGGGKPQDGGGGGGNGGHQNQGGKNGGGKPQDGGNKGGSNGNNGGGNGNSMQMGGGKKGINNGGGGGMGGPKMGMPMGHLGGAPNMPMGPMVPPAVQGLPAMNGGGPPNGYFQGAGPEMMAGNPFSNPNQQHYLQAIMNQQRAMGNERFQPMMYARPPPAVNYMPPYPYPYPPNYPGSDPYTNFFNDENTSSCNVM